MYCDLWTQYIQVQKLFKGGNYLRKYGSSGLQEQVQSFWAHCVMVERKKAETWTSCHPGRGTGCCTVRPNYKNPPEIKLKKNLENWLIILISATIWQNRKRKSWKLLWKIREITLKLKLNIFLAGFCHMEPLCAGTARTKWSRFVPRSHALEKFSCCVLEGPNRQTDSWLVFQKENTVCFTVKTVWFILSIEDNCDIFIYSCYNLTSFFPAVSWPIIGIPKHLSTSYLLGRQELGLKSG